MSGFVNQCIKMHYKRMGSKVCWFLSSECYKSTYQGRIQDFLRESASQVDMTDVQSQNSAKGLPNMHASTNWVGCQGQLAY